MVDTPRHGLSTINEEGDSRSTTPRPEQQRTPSIELSRRRTEEHARLAGIDQRLENLDKDRTEVPDALKDKGWEDCKNKLTDLKTTTSDTKDIEKIIESYENKINDAKLKKLRESMFERWNRYRELCRNLCGPLGEGRSSQALQDFSDRIVIDYNSAGSLEDRQKVHARFEKRIREMELD